MSLDINICQTGFIKKSMPLQIILGDSLAYGQFNGIRTDLGKLGEAQFMAYNPNHIGRGFLVDWKEGEKKEIHLAIATPTSREELKDFYQCVQRMSLYWKSKLIVDGNKMSLQKFMDSYEDNVVFNEEVQKKAIQTILSKENEMLTMHSALHPLTLGYEEAQMLNTGNVLDQLRDYMHQKQNIDVYYANPLFADDGSGIYGTYVLSENVRSIFPTKPIIPLGRIDPDTGKALEVSRWQTTFYSSTMERTVGDLPYDEFLKSLPVEKISRYDAQSILIENISLSEMKAILSN